jgi:hypothetical protein
MPKTREELRDWLTKLLADTSDRLVWHQADEVLSALDKAGIELVPKRLSPEMYDACFINQAEDPDDIWSAVLSASPYTVKP